MGFNVADLEEANEAQMRSKSIGERVAHLIRQDIDPGSIFAVSYTRAAAIDLGLKIKKYCVHASVGGSDKVNVSTLHSLALLALKKAGILDGHYPVAPVVLDNWELEHIFDAEFSKYSGFSKRRSKKIREYREAIWDTGQDNPGTYTPAKPPINSSENDIFNKFYRARSHLYACVLPGEMIRLCVEKMDAGTLNVAELLGVKHLIVDEFQDLNPMDLKFILQLVEFGVKIFACGDDDQSIYSFRHASPIGIQNFPEKFESTGDHTLSHCFRCSPNVLNAAMNILSSYSMPGRINKNYISMHERSEPSIKGVVHRIIFKSCRAEAKIIAASCKSLIDTGLPAREILVLLTNSQEQFKPLKQALGEASVPFVYQKTDYFKNDSLGRFLSYLLRVSNNSDDYFAMRGLMFFAKTTSPSKINAISEKIIKQSLNFVSAIKGDVSIENLTGSELKMLEYVRNWLSVVGGWNNESIWSSIKSQIVSMKQDILFSQESIEYWKNWSSKLPDEATRDEVLRVLDSISQVAEMQSLSLIRERLGMPKIEDVLTPDAVRIMTMHSSKGLDSKVVFIPGLEQRFIPGEQNKITGKVFESARLLYVAVTRAKVACILSFAQYRMVRGQNTKQIPSIFTSCLGGSFTQKTDGFESGDIAAICQEASLCD